MRLLNCTRCNEPAVGIAGGQAMCEPHLNEAGYGIITVRPYEAAWTHLLSDRDFGAVIACGNLSCTHPDCPSAHEGLLRRAPSLRTLRLRKASEPLPPWYLRSGLGSLSFIPHGDPVPFLPCESCGREISSLYDGKPICHGCVTMHAFAGIPLASVSLSACHPLPADWHRAALPSQRAAGEAYAAALKGCVP